MLLDAGEWDGTITIDVLWDAIETVASRAQLRASVANVHQILPPDADPDGEWRSALMSRYPLVRKFLRVLAETIEFGATTDAAPVLDALKALPGLLEVGPSKRIPAGFLDARKVAIEVVTPGWPALVFPRERPPETVDRVAYVFCVLDQFHQRLRRRDIFAVASSRWADPRAQLLSGQVWESARESLMDSLQLPPIPRSYSPSARQSWTRCGGTWPPERRRGTSPSTGRDGCTPRRLRRSPSRRVWSSCGGAVRR